MDIEKDIFDPERNIRRFHDGAYIYRSKRTNDYDINKYNIHYEQYRQKRKIQMQKDIERIKNVDMYNDNSLRQAPGPGKADIQIYNELIGFKEILVNFKDTLFNLIDDLLQYKFTIDTFTKNNRLLYLGMLLIIISIVIFIFYMFTIN